MNRLIVLDTNVIVSAAINSQGHPSRIIGKVLEGDLISALCPSIVGEYNEVLAREKFRRLGLPPIWLKILIEISHFLPKDPPVFAPKGPDPDDLVFLDLAAYLGAVLVTGNIKHFPQTIAKHVKVLSPADYILGLA